MSNTYTDASIQTIPLTGKILTGEIKVYGMRCYLQVFHGKKSKAYGGDTVENCRNFFATLDARQIAYDLAKAKRREERSIQRKLDTEAMRLRIQPGTLLHGSWGYDQTQCELFEVITIKGSKVTLQAVDFRREGTGWASENRFPLKGQFTGEPFVATISAGGVKLSDHCTLTPSDWSRGYYCSWYA